jgi:CubicO group peptidase (beta-lactamase class C family)
MSRAGLDGVRRAIQAHIDSNELLGVVSAIARWNKLVWFEAQGVRDPTTGAPMRKEDIFRMMSSTKPVAAVAVLMMVETGRLALDDAVSRFIPSFQDPKVIMPPPDWERALTDPQLLPEVVGRVEFVPADREITIRDLLTHRSGLSSAGLMLGPGPGTLVNQVQRSPDLTLADVVPQLGSFALDFQPGSRWSYSPVDGFDTLLHLVEIVSGQSAETLLRERLFEPLGMTDTHFNLPPEKQSRVLPLYERQDDVWRAAKPMFTKKPTKYFSGAGGLFSTARDFLQFEQMLFNKGELNERRLLKPETVELMATNHVGSMFAEWIPEFTAGMGFGLGLGVTLDPAIAKWGRGRGSFGWGGAYGTESWVDPENGLTAVFFVQQPVRPALAHFQHAIRKAIAD